MASSPKLKVFNPSGEYVASCKYYEDAACLAGHYGDGAEVRTGHSKSETIWSEGKEAFSASESYDMAREVMRLRENERWEKTKKKLGILE